MQSRFCHIGGSRVRRGPRGFRTFRGGQSLSRLLSFLPLDGDYRPSARRWPSSFVYSREKDPQQPTVSDVTRSHVSRFSLSDPGEARAVLQGRRRVDNLVAVGAVGAAAAATVAGSQFGHELVVVGGKLHDGE